MEEEHGRGTELSLETEGAFMSEKEIRELGKLPEVKYPGPGEPAHPEGPLNQTLKDVRDAEREAKEMDCE